jgi:hypothetical protein
MDRTDDEKRILLEPGQYLIHDRDGKFCPPFQHIIAAAGVQIACCSRRDLLI